MAIFICIFFIQSIGLAEIVYDRDASCLKTPTRICPDDIAEALATSPRAHSGMQILDRMIAAQHEGEVVQDVALGQLREYVGSNSEVFSSITLLPGGYLFQVTLQASQGGGTYALGYNAAGEHLFLKTPTWPSPEDSKDIQPVRGANAALRSALGGDIAVTRNFANSTNKGIERLRVINVEDNELTGEERAEIIRCIREDWVNWKTIQPNAPAPYHPVDIQNIADILEGKSTDREEFHHYIAVSMRDGHIAGVEAFSLVYQYAVANTPRREYSLLEIAPWNRTELGNARRYFGVGTQFLFRIIDEESRYPELLTLPVLVGAGSKRMVESEQLKNVIYDKSDNSIPERFATKTITYLNQWRDAGDPGAASILSNLKIEDKGPEGASPEWVGGEESIRELAKRIALEVRERLFLLGDCALHATHLARRLIEEGRFDDVQVMVSGNEQNHVRVKVRGESYLLDCNPQSMNKRCVEAARKLGDERVIVVKEGSDEAASANIAELYQDSVPARDFTRAAQDHADYEPFYVEEVETLERVSQSGPFRKKGISPEELDEIKAGYRRQLAVAQAKLEELRRRNSVSSAEDASPEWKGDKDTGLASEGLKVINRVRRFRDGTFTRRQFQEERGFSESTARAELEALVKLGILEVDKRAKTFQYKITARYRRAPPEIKRKIQKDILKNIPARPDGTLRSERIHVTKVLQVGEARRILEESRGEENIEERLEAARTLKRLAKYDFPKKSVPAEVDLHCHTYHSDGLQSPAALVYEAYRKGIKAIAITDHNNLAGVPEAIEIGRILGVEIIPGIEIMTSDYDGLGTEILAYFPDSEKFMEWYNSDESREFKEAMEVQALQQESQFFAVIEAMRQDFPELEISIEDDVMPLVKERPILPGCLSDVLWAKYNGDRDKISRILGGANISDSQGIYDNVIVKYMPKIKLLTPRKAIGLATRNGLVPVLAHPKQYLKKTKAKRKKQGLRSYVEHLVECGLKGIQVSGFRNTPEDTRYFLKLARDFGLVAIAGSDSHGVHKETNTQLGEGLKSPAFPRGNLNPELATYLSLVVLDPSRVKTKSLTKKNATSYAARLAEIDHTRNYPREVETPWDEPRFLEDKRTSTGTLLEGKWEYSQVALARGEPVAYAMAIDPVEDFFGDYCEKEGIILEDLKGKARHLLRITTDPNYRGLGIGRRLIRNFALKAQEDGIEDIFVDVIPRERTTEFYQRLGFERVMLEDYHGHPSWKMKARVDDLLANISGLETGRETTPPEGASPEWVGDKPATPAQPAETLEAIIAGIEKPFSELPSYRKWLRENKARLKEAVGVEVIPFVTITSMCLRAGKIPADWRRYGGDMALAYRLGNFFNQTRPEEGFVSWEITKKWLVANQEAATKINNEILNVEDTRETGFLSCSTILSALGEIEEIPPNWLYRAGAMDLAHRLKEAGPFRTEAEGGAIPDGGLTNAHLTREWLINNRQRVIDANNAALSKKGKRRTEILSYATIEFALHEAEIIPQIWSRQSGGMDYTRNNWQIYYSELKRCEVLKPLLPKDSEELYQFALVTFERKRFLYIEDQRAVDNIQALKKAVQEKTPYEDAAHQLHLSPAKAKKLQPYVEGKEVFIPKKLNPRSFRPYLREFCQAWTDIHNARNPALAGDILRNIGPVCTPLLEEFAEMQGSRLAQTAQELLKERPFAAAQARRQEPEGASPEFGGADVTSTGITADFAPEMQDCLIRMFNVAGMERFAEAVESGSVELCWGIPKIEGVGVIVAAKDIRGTRKLMIDNGFREAFERYLGEVGDKEALSKDYLLKITRIFAHEIGEKLTRRALIGRGMSTDDPSFHKIGEAAGISSEILLYRGGKSELGDKGWYNFELADEFNRRIGAHAEHLQKLREIMEESETSTIGDLITAVSSVSADSRLGELLNARLKVIGFEELTDEEFALLRDIIRINIAPSRASPSAMQLRQLDQRSRLLAQGNLPQTIPVSPAAEGPASTEGASPEFKGEEVSIFTHEGRSGEDRFIVRDVETPQSKGRLFAVFDGHVGQKVSAGLGAEFAEMFSMNLNASNGNAEEALRSTIRYFAVRYANEESGSTVSAVYIPDGSRAAYVAALGDSPIVWRNEDGSVGISPQHNMHNIEEQERAKRSFEEIGYEVSLAEKGMILRALREETFINYGAVTRTIGDRGYELAIPEPDVFEIPFENIRTLILASDGLFVAGPRSDLLEADAAYLLHCVENGQNARALVDDAIERGSTDDITAIVIAKKEGPEGTSPEWVPGAAANPLTQMVRGVFAERGYEIIGNSPVGGGSRAFVYRARGLDGRMFAIKIANPEEGFDYSDYMNGRRVYWANHGVFNHNFSAIVQLYDSGIISVEDLWPYAPHNLDDSMTGNLDRFLQSRAGGLHYQILEFFDGRKLTELFDEEFFEGKDINRLFESLVDFISGINEMHNNGLSHGELGIHLVHSGVGIRRPGHNVAMDENMQLKAHDIDTVRFVTVGDERDRKDLQNIAVTLLEQASRNTPHKPKVDAFFEEWSENAVAERGLLAFREGLNQLKEEIATPPSKDLGKEGASPEWVPGSLETDRRAIFTTLASETHQAMLAEAEKMDDGPVCYDYAFHLKGLLEEQHGIASHVKKVYVMLPDGEWDVHYWVETEDGWRIDPYAKGNPLRPFAGVLSECEWIVMSPEDTDISPYYPEGVTTNVNPRVDVQQQDKIKVMILPQLSELTDGETAVELNAGRIQDVIGGLIERFPRMKEVISVQPERLTVRDDFRMSIDAYPPLYAVAADYPVSIHRELAIALTVKADLFTETIRFSQNLRALAEEAKNNGEELVVGIDTDIGNLGKYADELFKVLEGLQGREGFENLKIIPGEGKSLGARLNAYLTEVKKGKKKVRVVAIAKKKNVERDLFNSLGDNVQVVSVDDAPVMSESGRRLLYHISTLQITEIIRRALANGGSLKYILDIKDDPRRFPEDELENRYREAARYLRNA